MNTAMQCNPKIISRNTGVSRLLRDQRGAASVEYIIIAGLIAIACIGAFQRFGTAVSGRVDAQATTIGGIPSAAGQ